MRVWQICILFWLVNSSAPWHRDTWIDNGIVETVDALCYCAMVLLSISAIIDFKPELLVWWNKSMTDTTTPIQHPILLCTILCHTEIVKNANAMQGSLPGILHPDEISLVSMHECLLFPLIWSITYVHGVDWTKHIHTSYRISSHGDHERSRMRGIPLHTTYHVGLRDSVAWNCWYAHLKCHWICLH